jgi:hypothetical protein
VCLLAAPRGAAAEWHITPMVGSTFAGKTTLFNPGSGVEGQHKDIGAAVTLLGAGVIGAETIIVFTPGVFTPHITPLTPGTQQVGIKSSRTIALMGNAVLTVPRRWTEYFLRPFVSGGVGVLHARQVQVIEALPPVNVNMPGFNIGGGAIGFLTKGTGVRFDVRYYRSLHGGRPGDNPLPGARLRFMTASIGLVIRR